MRNLTKTIALVSLLAPASGYPLGIGDIKLHSALNQNLDAEIGLEVSVGEHIDDIKVKLASPDKFDEAGITWNYFLSKIKFEKIARADGSISIKLTSSEALKEPFLDFMLEVTWPKGRLYREFTVLVDPPATYQQTVVPVTVTSKPAVEKTEPKAAAVTKDFQVESPEAPAKEVQQTAVTTEGQVKTTTADKGDTLWKVAERVNNNDDVATEQMVIALYEANPKAFYKKNINALMANASIDVPEKNEIIKISRTQALAEYNRQNKVWQGRIQPVSEKKSEPVAEEKQPEIDSKLTLVAPTEEDIAEDVVLAAGETDDVPGDEGAKVDETAVTVETKTAETEETASLRIKLERLEQQLMMMQKMLALKDAQIAALQNRTQPKEATVSEEEKASIDSVAKSQTSIQPDQVAEETSKQVAQQTQGDQGKVASTTATATTAPATAAKPTVKKPEATPEASKPAVIKSEEPKKEKVRTRVKPKPEVITDDSGIGLFTWIIAGGAALIFGGLGVLWWRKRKVEEQTNSESMFAATSEINLPNTDEALAVPIMEDNASYDIGNTGESSFISDFSSATDFDAFETEQTEVDPVSEADVYLAYGRYQQAEELMRQAIIDQPERDECKLKLLEIFYANENLQAFDEYSNQLAAEGKQEDSAFWDKLLEMRKELSPDSELSLSEAGTTAENAASDTEAKASPAEQVNDDLEQEKQSEFEDTDDLDALDFDLSLDDSVEDIMAEDLEKEPAVDEPKDEVQSSEAEPEESFMADSVTEIKAETETVQEIDNHTLDFDLDSFDLDSDMQVEAKEKPEIAEDRTLDFDLDSLDLPNENVADTSDSSVQAASENTEEIESIDFDFELPLEEEGTLEKTEESGISLDSLELPEGLEQESDAEEEKTIDESDFDFDLDFPDTENQEQSSEQNVTDLTDMDEFETKIDLARAYLGMDDKEAAESMAREVLEKGNEKQKEVAQSIIDSLG